MNNSNISVIKKIQLIRLTNLNIPSFNFYNIKLSQICSDKSLLETIPFIQRTAKFTDKEKISKAGNYFEKKLIFDIAKLTPELSANLNKYSNNKLAVIITDGNNYSHLIYPVTLSQARDLPGNVKQTNKTSIEISGKWMYATPFISLDL